MTTVTNSRARGGDTPIGPVPSNIGDAGSIDTQEVWYLFDEDTTSSWYIFGGELEGESFSADLQAVSGPPLSLPFDPDQVSFDATAGTVVLQFSPVNRSAQMSALINGTAKTLNITPLGQ